MGPEAAAGASLLGVTSQNRLGAATFSVSGDSHCLVQWLKEISLALTIGMMGYLLLLSRGR